tara:strand:- start:157 stop:624 length:468 start_codon:yes stop_codon:yes gene_type:complete
MVFWKWWTTIVIVALMASILEYYIGASSFIWERDSTKISVLILGIFTVVSMFIGYYSYQIQFKSKKVTDGRLQPLWYFSETVMSVGMVGTLVGFLMVLTTTFVDIDTTSTQEMKRVIGDLASGMGIALLTSLCGLVSSILLKFQLVLLDAENEKI